MQVAREEEKKRAPPSNPQISFHKGRSRYRRTRLSGTVLEEQVEKPFYYDVVQLSGNPGYVAKISLFPTFPI